MRIILDYTGRLIALALLITALPIMIVFAIGIWLSD